MLAKYLVLALAGAFMTAVIVWLGRQMILFLEEIMHELEDTETKGEKHE